VKSAIFGHDEFAAFNGSIMAHFGAWRSKHVERLRSIDQAVRPKELIEELAESLLETFQAARLIDPYDVYQHLMDYWAESMQDDLYLIEESGWIVAARPRLVVEKEPHDFAVGKQKLKSDLIPMSLLIEHYYPKEQAAIVELESELAAADARLEELAEEHGGDDGLLTSVIDEKGKISRKAVGARLREVGRDPELADERETLDEYAAAMEAQAVAKDRLKKAQGDLESKVATKYGELTEEEIKALVVEHKWLARIESDVRAELDGVSRSLTSRVRTLAERYATPLPQLAAQVDELSARVEEHLERMGAVWN
jgi:type I restriction enzyme M protein